VMLYVRRRAKSFLR